LAAPLGERSRFIFFSSQNHRRTVFRLRMMVCVQTGREYTVWIVKAQLFRKAAPSGTSALAMGE